MKDYYSGDCTQPVNLAAQEKQFKKLCGKQFNNYRSAWSAVMFLGFLILLWLVLYSLFQIAPKGSLFHVLIFTVCFIANIAYLIGFAWFLGRKFSKKKKELAKKVGLIV